MVVVQSWKSIDHYKEWKKTPIGHNLLKEKNTYVIIYNALSYYKINGQGLSLKEEAFIDNLKEYMKFILKENKRAHYLISNQQCDQR